MALPVPSMVRLRKPPDGVSLRGSPDGVSLRGPPDGGGGNGRPPPTPGSVARRRVMVQLSKRVLPVLAIGLLASVGLWPEISRNGEQTRLSYHVGVVTPQGGELSQARYNGLDEHGQPYTVTADKARQVGADRYDLTGPVGDLTTTSGSWLQVRADDGVYMQIVGMLDLSGEVVLYRDDGTVLRTDAATIDVKSGSATSAEMTHVEGPFGTLDAQGFTATDNGQLIRFVGPGRLVLNGGRR
jgi:lipopolysaccharide export system protein LptC